MQTKESIQNIIRDCNFSYAGNALLPRVLTKGDGFLIQIRAYLPDNCTVHKQLTLQSGAKHYISSYAIDDEVVMTLWKAVQDFVIHEARESFLYKGQRIFGPHFSIEELRRVSATTKEVKRL